MDYLYLKGKAAFNLKKKSEREKEKERGGGEKERKLTALTRCIGMLLNLRNLEG